MCEMGEDGQKIQTCSYKIHLSPADVRSSMVTIVNNTVLYLKVNRVDFKSSHHKKTIVNYVW